MLSLLLAGVVFSGTISQSASHTVSHITPMGTGSRIGTSMITTRTIEQRQPATVDRRRPRRLPGNVYLGNQVVGTATQQRCRAYYGEYEIVYTTFAPQGCLFDGRKGLWLFY